MKITIKLKPSEVFALIQLIERAIETDYSESRTDAIIILLMLKFYKKIKEKSIMLSKDLRMQLPPECALAFIEYFKDYQFDCTKFEDNLLLKLVNKFDKETISFHY